MTNPETCRHRVLLPNCDTLVSERYPSGRWWLTCFSCKSDIPKGFLEGKIYEYDIDHNCWVQIGPSRK